MRRCIPSLKRKRRINYTSLTLQARTARVFLPMHVVIVDGDVSYPATSGKRLRTLNLMLQVAKRHRITYVGRCAADSGEARVAPAFLRDHNIEPILVPHPVPHKAGASFYLRLF